MNNWQRLFAYITGVIVFGLLIIVSTQSFFGYVNNPGWIGFAALAGYGLIFVNLSYFINRRFTQKREEPSAISYLMAALLVLPTLVWAFSKKTALAESRLAFTLTVVFAVFLGAYYGIKAGIRKRAEYLQRKREEQELPDDLQRPHDELSNN